MLLSGLREHARPAGPGPGKEENWTGAEREKANGRQQHRAGELWGALRQGSGRPHKPFTWGPWEGWSSPCPTTASEPCGCQEGTDRKIKLSVSSHRQRDAHGQSPSSSSSLTPPPFCSQAPISQLKSLMLTPNSQSCDTAWGPETGHQLGLPWTLQPPVLRGALWPSVGGCTGTSGAIAHTEDTQGNRGGHWAPGHLQLPGLHQPPRLIRKQTRFAYICWPGFPTRQNAVL